MCSLIIQTDSQCFYLHMFNLALYYSYTHVQVYQSLVYSSLAVSNNSKYFSEVTKKLSDITFCVKYVLFLPNQAKSSLRNTNSQYYIWKEQTIPKPNHLQKNFLYNRGGKRLSILITTNLVWWEFKLTVILHFNLKNLACKSTLMILNPHITTVEIWCGN